MSDAIIVVLVLLIAVAALWIVWHGTREPMEWHTVGPCGWDCPTCDGPCEEITERQTVLREFTSDDE